MVPVTRAQAIVAARLLDMAADEFHEHGREINVRVRYDGREFLIEFQYEMAICAKYRDEREMTTCWIRDGNAPRGEREPAPAICRGAVARYFQDPPNREKARKESLRKALEFLDQFLPSDAQNRRGGEHPG